MPHLAGQEQQGNHDSMDPYDILGIRPNAGRDEIELAYKGRRSQYHPDRYAQSDWTGQSSVDTQSPLCA